MLTQICHRLVLFLTFLQTHQNTLFLLHCLRRIHTRILSLLSVEVARSSGYQHDLSSDLTDYLAGVENVSKLLARTAERCTSEAVKQVCSSLLLKSHNPLQQVCVRTVSSVRDAVYPWCTWLGCHSRHRAGQFMCSRLPRCVLWHSVHDSHSEICETYLGDPQKYCYSGGNPNS